MVSISKHQLRQALIAWRGSEGKKRGLEKISQEEAAERLDAKIETYRKWEHGKNKPPSTALRYILQIILPEGHSFEIPTTTEEGAKTADQPS